MSFIPEQEDDYSESHRGNHWLPVQSGLKRTPVENGAMAKGHYSDSLSRKLERILSNHEYSDAEDMEATPVQGNLEMQLAKLLDDTEDDASSSVWSVGSSNSSTEPIPALEHIRVGMFDGASNSNLDLSNNPVQPLGVELAAALHSPSQNSSDSEETVGEDDGSLVCVFNDGSKLTDGWMGSDNCNELSNVEANETTNIIEGQTRSGTAMYPSSSTSNSSDSDNDGVCITKPVKQYSVFLSPVSSTIQSDEAENDTSSKSPILHADSPTIQVTTKSILPAEKGLPYKPSVSIKSKSPIELDDVQSEISDNSLVSSKQRSPETPEQDGATSTISPKSLQNTSTSEESAKSDQLPANELELVKLQLQEVIARQNKMMESFQSERKQLRLQNFKQRKIITRLQREREADHCKLQNIVRHADLRVESVEEKMVALVEHCAILKEQITTMDTVFQQSPMCFSPSQSPSAAVVSPPTTSGKKLTKAFSTGMVNKHKVKKLQKFFGESPPLLQMFLQKLGYEQYLSYFERERIGLVELPHITEEQLIQLGIPMGPRQRIIDEAARL